MGVEAGEPCSVVVVEIMVLSLLARDRQQEKYDESGLSSKLDTTGCTVAESRIMDNSDEHRCVLLVVMQMMILPGTGDRGDRGKSPVTEVA